MCGGDHVSTKPEACCQHPRRQGRSSRSRSCPTSEAASEPPAGDVAVVGAVGSHGCCGQVLWCHFDLCLRPSSNLVTLGKSLHLSEPQPFLFHGGSPLVPALRPVWCWRSQSEAQHRAELSLGRGGFRDPESPRLGPLFPRRAGQGAEKGAGASWAGCGAIAGLESRSTHSAW